MKLFKYISLGLLALSIVTQVHAINYQCLEITSSAGQTYVAPSLGLPIIEEQNMYLPGDVLYDFNSEFESNKSYVQVRGQTRMKFAIYKDLSIKCDYPYTDIEVNYQVSDDPFINKVKGTVRDGYFLDSHIYEVSFLAPDNSSTLNVWFKVTGQSGEQCIIDHRGKPLTIDVSSYECTQLVLDAPVNNNPWPKPEVISPYLYKDKKLGELRSLCLSYESGRFNALVAQGSVYNIEGLIEFYNSYGKLLSYKWSPSKMAYESANSFKIPTNATSVKVSFRGEDSSNTMIYDDNFGRGFILDLNKTAENQTF